MRELPTLGYKGLTVVLSNPSRKDDKHLLSGYAGAFFNEDCLQPYCNRWQCDIRTADTIGTSLLPETKALLLLGEHAMHTWAPKYINYSINEQRGCPLENPYQLPCIASFFPQDCMDIIDYEKKFNAQELQEDSHKEDKEVYEGKRKGATARSNYRFWLQQDTRKILNYRNKKETSLANYHIYPSLTECVARLTHTTNDYLILDIETDSDLNILCFSFSFSDYNIYVVPCIRYDYTLAYSGLSNIYRALAKAISQNTTVTHNSQFDLLVLAWKYHLPIGPLHYDTMLAQHRCYPEAEKSLGHCMSLWTWEPYHKDEGIFSPQSPQQEHKLWEYNGKDVYGTMLVREAIDNYSKKIPGLRESIAQSNDCIRPYLINTLLGIRYDKQKLEARIQINDRFMMQYTRCIKHAIGIELYETLKGKANGNIASSSKQAAKYFHEMLGYDVVSRSKITGAAKLDADALYKIKLKHKENPVIDLILKYRERAKETGSLSFTPWKE